MDRAKYTTNSNKEKLHLGFDLNHGIPHKLFLTEGQGAESIAGDSFNPVTSFSQLTI